MTAESNILGRSDSLIDSNGSSASDLKGGARLNTSTRYYSSCFSASNSGCKCHKGGTPIYIARRTYIQSEHN